MTNDDKLMGVTEVAAELGLTEADVRQWARNDGEVARIGTTWVFRVGDVARLVGDGADLYTGVPCVQVGRMRATSTSSRTTEQGQGRLLIGALLFLSSAAACSSTSTNPEGGGAAAVQAARAGAAQSTAAGPRTATHFRSPATSSSAPAGGWSLRRSAAAPRCKARVAWTFRTARAASHVRHR